MVPCSWLASIAPAPSWVTLAVAPATAAATAASQPESPSLRDSLLMGGLIAWLVLAVWAMIKWGVFAARPLRLAPRRSSTGLIPVVLGTILLYFIFGGIAMQIGISMNLFTLQTIQPPSPSTTAPSATYPATAPASAPATAPATAPDPLEVARAAQLRSEQQMYAQCFNIAAQLAACICALGLAHSLTSGGIRKLGLWHSDIPRGAVLGILGYLLIFPLLYVDSLLVFWLYSAYEHKPTQHDTVTAIQNTADFNVRLIFALVAGIGAPLAEEFVFRGLLQTAIIQRGWGFVVRFPPDTTYNPPAYQRWGAIVICSLLFCMLHPLDHMPILFLLSVALGYLYERTGNLWACIVLHAAFNWWTLVQLLRS